MDGRKSKIEAVATIERVEGESSLAAPASLELGMTKIRPYCSTAAISPQCFLGV
jgi:hypothetical protein